jgi:hypothetical protein
MMRRGWPERRANRDLAPASGAARHQQVREVDAREMRSTVVADMGAPVMTRSSGRRSCCRMRARARAPGVDPRAAGRCPPVPRWLASVVCGSSRPTIDTLRVAAADA